MVFRKFLENTISLLVKSIHYIITLNPSACIFSITVSHQRPLSYTNGKLSVMNPNLLTAYVIH